MGWNPAKEVKKWYNRVKDEANKGINTLKNETNRQINRVKWHAKKGIEEVQDTASSAKRDVEKVFDKAKDEIEDVAEGAVKEVKDEIEKMPDLAEDVIEKALDALCEAIAKEGLTTVRNVARTAKRELDEFAESDADLVDEINELGFTLVIGPVSLAYSGFYTRADQVIGVLDTYVNSPPAFRRKPILDMIEALGPTSVDFGVDIKAALLVVASDAISVGIELDSIRLRLFTRLGDKLLAELGVPE